MLYETSELCVIMFLLQCIQNSVKYAPLNTPLHRRTTMIDRTFDPATMIAAAREAFAPVLKAQQEGFKHIERLARLQYAKRSIFLNPSCCANNIERLARLQYAVAGDVLENGLARVNAAFVATNANELLSKHTELTTEFVDKLRARA